jgi:signal transduction histidine kinase
MEEVSPSSRSTNCSNRLLARAAHLKVPGLGLTVVQKVVELHCGTIAVKTSEMGGAAFIIDLFPGTGASRGPARAQVELPKSIDQLAAAE